MEPHAGHAPWISYAIPLIVLAIVMALRWRSMSRARRLRLETLWIMPAVYAVMAVLVFAGAPPSPRGWLLAALALAVGAVAGWQRGRLMRITVDPETHSLSQQASPAAFLMLIVLIALRSAAKAEFAGGSGHGLGLATDIAIAFGLGLVAATRIEMMVRARRMLSGTRSL